MSSYTASPPRRMVWIVPSSHRSLYRALLAALALTVAACGGSSSPKPADASGDGVNATDGKSDGAGGTAGTGTGGTGGVDAAAPIDGVIGIDGAAGDDGAIGNADGGGDAAKTLARLELSPPTLTLPAGISQVLTATAIYSDGSTTDVSASAVFASSAAGVATIAGNTVIAVAVGTATVTGTFMGKSATTTVTVSSATLSSIALEPSAPKLAIGTHVTLAATAIFSDGTKQDVTTSAVWSSSNVAIAKVSTSGDGSNTEGVLTGVAAGTATISAKLMNVTGSVGAEVTAATVTALDVTPSHPTIPIGTTRQFQATATYSDSTTQDVTSQATWTTSDATVATVTAGGLVTTKVAGSVDLQAVFAGVTGKTTAVVMGTTLVSIQVAPGTASLPVGVTQAFTATGTYSDQSKVDLTASVVWSSSAAAVSVSNAAGDNGHAAALAAGTATVSAALDGVTGSATVTVTAAVMTSLAVAPKVVTLPLGLRQSLIATATYNDASTHDVSAQAVWSSSDATVAGVTNTASGGINPGTVTSLKVGTATITASFGGFSDTSAVTTTAATLTAIDVAPATATSPAGARQSFTATGHYTDATTADVTTQVTWSSSALNIATVSNAAGSQGVATSLVPGSATITATAGGQKGMATYTVTAAVLQALQITPFTSSVRVGATELLSATAIFTNGTTQNVSGTATWTSSNATVATVATTTMGMGMMAAARGQVTGKAVGTATISISYMGLMASASVSVTAVPTLQSLSISPALATVRVGQMQAFEAAAIYSDGTTTNVTATTTWTSSAPAVATIGNGGGMGGGRGNATARAVGTTTISATYMGITMTATLTVVAPMAVGLQINPAVSSLLVGQSEQLAATLLFDDGSTQNVSGMTTWTSSAPAIVAVSDAGRGGTPRGTATAVTVGAATVTASYMSYTATATVTATAPTLTAVQVTPTSPMLLKGSTLQLQATAVYSDLSIRNVTADALWTTDDATVAAVTSTGMRGRVTGLKGGTSNVKASYQGVVGSTAVTVKDATVTSVQVNPTNPTVPVGVPQRFTATALLSDTTTIDVTTSATWTSSDGGVAALSNAAGSQGLATPITSGTVTVTATYMGTAGTTTLTVSTGHLTAITVTEAGGSLAVGGHQQLVATGMYDDARSFDLTTLVTWVSTTPATATDSNAAGSQGLVTGVASGTTTIEAHYQGVTGSGSITVP